MVYKVGVLFLSFLLCFILLEEVAPHDSSPIDDTIAVGESQQCDESSSNNCKNDEDNDNNDKERVVFGGKLELHSKPLPRSVTRDSLIRFFSEEQETNVRIIASAGGDRVTERIPSTVELETYWYETCHDTYGIENCLPSNNDEDPHDPIIYATNTTTQFKGLFFKLTTTSYNGVKTIIPDDEKEEEKERGDSDNNNGSDSAPMPKYVFNMIAEQQHPEGPAPIVWAFHKICGFCAERDSLKPCGRVQAIMSATKVVVSDDDNTSSTIDEQQLAEDERQHQQPASAPPDYYDYYALTFSINIHIQIEFPKRLSKFLPLKKDNGIETKVSKQILSILSKDIERNLQVFHEKFLNWHDDDDSGDDGNANGDDDDGGGDDGDDGRCQ